MTEERDRAPVLRVVRGNPSAEELAALVAVVAAVGTAAAPAGPRRTSLWARRSREAVPLPTAGAGAWRSSFLPH